MKKIGIILLAAGGSSRMGQPKQLLQYGDKTLVQHALDAATAALSQPIVIVTGAYKDLVQTSLGINIIHNADWKEGIASSIRTGLNAILEIEPGLDAIIFIVCDQPHISATLLKELMDTHNATGKAIVASSYADTVGIPALFGKSFFNALMQLKGDEGAKRIIMQNPDSVAVVDFPRGDIDIDTAGDYAALRGKDTPPV
jgi:molybdenum cofactor cytidylyltransferase